MPYAPTDFDPGARRMLEAVLWRRARRSQKAGEGSGMELVYVVCYSMVDAQQCSFFEDSHPGSNNRSDEGSSFESPNRSRGYQMNSSLLSFEGTGSLWSISETEIEKTRLISWLIPPASSHACSMVPRYLSTSASRSVSSLISRMSASLAGSPFVMWPPGRNVLAFPMACARRM